MVKYIKSENELEKNYVQYDIVIKNHNSGREVTTLRFASDLPAGDIEQMFSDFCENSF